MTEIQTNDVALLEQVATGDQQAFETLFEKYSGSVMLLANNMLHSKVLAQDVVQDIFLQLWQKKDTLNAIENFRNWLSVVTRNKCLHVLEQVAKRGYDAVEQLNYIPSYLPDGENAMRKKQIEEKLQKEIANLPDQQRKVFEMAKFQGLSRIDIATELDISPLTVKKHLAVATRTLRARLSEHFDLVLMMMVMNKFF